MGRTVVVVGAGVFGTTAAAELAARGWSVTLVDPAGDSPHPEAASTDIAKMIRADYGTDGLYIDLMDECFPIWREWNTRWDSNRFHEDGFLILAGGPMEPGGYEHTSYHTLLDRGYPLEHLDTTAIGDRFPLFQPPVGTEAYLNPIGGWAESGWVVGALLQETVAAGVRRVDQRVARLHTDGDMVEGVVLDDGERVDADLTIVTAGAWTAELVPGLDRLITTTGHPIMHFRPEDPTPYRASAYPPWAADIANTGWYGFPAIDGVVKVANHGPGLPIQAAAPRSVADDWEPRFRSFLSAWIPVLADAPVVYTRLCLYTDTTDGDFLIDKHPGLGGLVVATGGSGHGFKFAPILGRLIADVADGAEPLERFRWRIPSVAAKEPARHLGDRP
ncbi:MAG: FAD-dependent oxidoreductase [Acidimicrobiia bacterium]|nr:FAD-dependent oxidoreductase [Acidimicrobiia bacterium]MBT8217688.1 FAD-dependent oxidoreductase [Acidimicrobiia bacterium]NNF10869.1 FAD-dependent oxidoreductase [Acidimicrobiia bacterium]NNL71241.1 FAD-dependent oxidoreductase [Acidimicrobiia bacterium]